MATISEYYEFAKLATASYVRLEDVGEASSQYVAAEIADLANEQRAIPLALARRMFDPAFSNGEPVWSVSSGGYYGNDSVGFAATLFQRDMEKVLAIRGTEPDAQNGIDLYQADLAAIGVLGMSFPQAVSMVNYIMRLRAGAMDTAVPQLHIQSSLEPISSRNVTAQGQIFDVEEGATPVTVYIDFSVTLDGQGLGLIGQGERVTVTGHSLGGHLAALAARLFPDLVNSQVFVYNTPGFDPASASYPGVPISLFSGYLSGAMGLVAADLKPAAQKLTNQLVGLFRAALLPNAAPNFDALNIVNLESENLAPGNDSSLIASIFTGAQVLGPETLITTERNSHLIEPFMDSLAMHALLYGLNNNLTLNDITRIYQSASNNDGNTLERLLEALTVLFRGESANLSPVVDIDEVTAVWSNEPGNIDGRRSYYSALVALEDVIKASPQQFTLRSLLDISADALTNLAINGDADATAYRFALRGLNPFAVFGPPALYQMHNQNGELNLYTSSSATPGGMTPQYLTDRAQMLAFLMTGNTNDTTAFASNQVNDQVLYSDLVKRLVAGSIEGEPTSLNVFMVSGTPNPRGPSTRVIGFGTDGVDALQGRDNRDHLYGGAGADVLDGGKNDDYLEGGEGMDTYVYRAETSFLQPNWNDGDDEIRDTDGRGSILYTFTGSGGAGTSSRAIGGIALKQPDGRWQSTDGKFVYERQDKDLRVSIMGDAGGSLLIRDFDFAAASQAGSFGIRLVDAVAPTPANEHEFEGDRRSLGSYSTIDLETGNVVWHEPDVLLYDEYGNVVRDPSLVLENVSDVFHGSPDSDGIYGRGGNDRLYGADGDDLLLGGGGNDYIEGGAGNDVISGHEPEAGQVPLYDELHGGDGNDLIFAGAVQSLEDAFDAGGSVLIGDTSRIFGEAGDDILVGSSLLDFIYGGAGDDLIVDGKDGILNGDDGDDVIYALGRGASLVGGMGNDTLVVDESSPDSFGSEIVGGTKGYAPGDGDDILIGSPVARDRMQGGDGSDLIFAGGGNDSFADSFWAYFAPDTIYMGEGNDAVSASHGDDFIDGGPGSDTLGGSGGDDVIHGGTGDDRLDGGTFFLAAKDPGSGSPLTYVAVESGNDTLYGEEGDDTLVGGEGDDSLIGDVGNDVLQGGAGDDWLDGGLGNDSVQGGSGGDVYVFNVGDGVDTVTDFDEGLPGQDSIFFGEGIAPEDLNLLASPFDTGLFVVLPGTEERIEIRSWFADEEGFGGEQFRIESFVFADGTTWDSAEAESKVVFGGPTPGRDQLAGTSGDDVIHALAGADQITDSAGNDILFGDEGGDRITDSEGHNLLVGGDGNDLLRLNGIPIYDVNGGQIGLDGGSPGSFAIGGAGSDGVPIGDHSVVAYNAGDSEDSIRWTEGDVQLLTISLGGGISIDDISLFYSMDTSLLMLGLGPEIPPDVEGDYVPQEAIVLPNLLSLPESWPTLVLQVIDDDVRAYNLGPVVEAYNAELAQNPGTARWSAAQALQENLLGVSTTHAMGGAIAYQYATTGTVDGLAPAQIRSVLTNANFGLAPQAIVPSAANSTPLLDNAIVDQTATEDAAFAFTVPADTFSDPDAGDVLAYTASLADGTGLPAWLSFDTETRTFAGTPLQVDVGALEVAVTATDAGGLSAADTFALTVVNVNDAPAVASPLADLSFEAGTPFSFSVPAGTFADEDAGDTLSLSATLFDGGALPAWLSFDPAAAVFTGNPSVTDIGISPILVTAVDGAGATAQSGFGLVVRVPAGAEATGSAGDDVIYGGTGDETLTAKGGNDYLFGDVGNDLLKGGGGNDVLQAGAGDDVLRGGKGQNVLDGGAGNDLIFGGAGSAFILGGAGNDTLRVGSGNDVITFNAGDGMDTVYGGRDGGNTLSFGGGIRYSDLSLSKSGKDLVVSTGAGEGVTLKNWYGGNHSVLNLQIMLDATEEFDAGSSDPLYNRRVQTFDFLGMVSAFDTARAATPGLTSWEMTNALLAFHLSGADDMAIGGDLAYWYGKSRTLQAISLQSAQQVIGSANFGSEAQTLRPFSGLQEGFVKLA